MLSKLVKKEDRFIGFLFATIFSNRILSTIISQNIPNAYVATHCIASCYDHLSFIYLLGAKTLFITSITKDHIVLPPSHSKIITIVAKILRRKNALFFFILVQ